MKKTTKNKRKTPAKKQKRTTTGNRPKTTVKKTISQSTVNSSQSSVDSHQSLDDKKEVADQKPETSNQKLAIVDESEVINEIEETNNQPAIEIEAPYYQVDGLHIDEELKKCDHMDEHKFYALGMDFVNAYNELKSLVEKGEEENKVLEKDDQLVSMLSSVFSEISEVTVDHLGNIPDTIRAIAMEHKVLLEKASIMVKKHGENIVFYAIGNNAAPIMTPTGPKTYTIDNLQGSSEIITTENFLKAFSNLKSASNTNVFFISLKGDEVMVRLFVNGQQDIVFGEKFLENWLKR